MESASFICQADESLSNVDSFKGEHDGMMVLSSTRDHRKNVMKPIRVRIALEL